MLTLVLRLRHKDSIYREKSRKSVVIHVERFEYVVKAHITRKIILAKNAMTFRHIYTLSVWMHIKMEMAIFIL